MIMDERYSRIFSRTSYQGEKSLEDYERIKSLMVASEQDQQVYDAHLKYLEDQLSELRDSIRDLKHSMNETIDLLKLTASSFEVDKLHTRAEKVDFNILLKREDFRKMLEGI
jgi:hypothetical protein